MKNHREKLTTQNDKSLLNCHTLRRPKVYDSKLKPPSTTNQLKKAPKRSISFNKISSGGKFKNSLKRYKPIKATENQQDSVLPPKAPKVPKTTKSTNLLPHKNEFSEKV